MKAFVLVGHGGLDKLEYHSDWPDPVAAPGEVVVGVAACGLNNTDINTRTAWYSKPVTEGITEASGAQGFAQADTGTGSWSNALLEFPRIQGADVAGNIVAVGDGVDSSRIGERVMIDPWLLPAGDWQDAERARYLGSERNGGFAGLTTVPADNAIAVHSEQTDAELATYACAYTTAENLIARTGLRPGEAVVIAGASGGVGSAAIQLCRLRGAKVIGVASESKSDVLKSLGAATVIDRNVDDLETSIREAAGGSVEVVLDTVGGGMFMPLVNALRQGGRYSSCGSIAGPMVSFDLRALVYKDLQMTGATIVPPGTMRRVVRLIEQGLLKPLLAGTYPLENLHEAQQAFMDKQFVGNIVVTVE